MTCKKFVATSLEYFQNDPGSNELISEWAILWGQSSTASIFNSPWWFESAVINLHESVKNRVIVVRSVATEELVAILPLVQVRLFGLHVFMHPANHFVDRYEILLRVFDASIYSCMMEECVKHGIVFLSGITSKESTDLMCRMGETVTRFGLDSNPYIEQPSLRFGENVQRRKSRTLQRALHKFDTVDLKITTEYHDEALKTAFRIDMESSKNRRGMSTFDKQEYRNFFLYLARLAPRLMYVAILYFGNEPVSFNIGFKYRGIYACSQKAHLERFQKYRPGGISFLMFLDSVSKADVSEIDIGRGEDKFKIEYTDTVRTLFGVVISQSVMRINYIRAAIVIKRWVYEIVIHHCKLYKVLTLRH